MPGCWTDYYFYIYRRFERLIHIGITTYYVLYSFVLIPQLHFFKSSVDLKQRLEFFECNYQLILNFIVLSITVYDCKHSVLADRCQCCVGQ